jgi:hypothetical protein
MQQVQEPAPAEGPIGRGRLDGHSSKENNPGRWPRHGIANVMRIASKIFVSVPRRSVSLAGNTLV